MPYSQLDKRGEPKLHSAEGWKHDGIGPQGSVSNNKRLKHALQLYVCVALHIMLVLAYVVLAGISRHHPEHKIIVEPGKAADLAVWDVNSPAELVYRIGFNPLRARFFEGERTFP